MSAVPETLFVAPPAAALDGEACRGAQTETLILARCAVQIAAEAGPEAILVELGGGSNRSAALLKAAIEALPRSPLRGAAGRRLRTPRSRRRMGALPVLDRRAVPVRHSRARAREELGARLRKSADLPLRESQAARASARQSSPMQAGARS